MKIIDYTHTITKEHELSAYFTGQYNPEDLLFFDIETTGFIAKHTTLYLIGVLWFKNNTIHIRQWFNDNGCDEKVILTSFLEFTHTFTHLIHFNGLGFDLPYLKQKADIHNLTFSLEECMTQIDIYKEIRSYKNLFALDNMKQVSIEDFLGIARDDEKSGKELIRVYQQYIGKPDEQLEHLLLLHNHDDLLGMTKISHIMNYKWFIESPTIASYTCNQENNYLVIHFQVADGPYLPKRITATKCGIHLNAIEQKGILSVPICKDTLKHFFTDYKNYYYLPLEDIAIHKSVATYVDSHNKVKASKETCYISKTDSFIPSCSHGDYEYFRTDWKTKQEYILLSAFLEADDETKIQYITKTLSMFL
ncbi:MAG: rnase H family protein [Lachnospiraceae bacterium]|nr:rnase H family protein [Lachnospiraceae bacterium]